MNACVYVSSLIHDLFLMFFARFMIKMMRNGCDKLC